MKTNSVTQTSDVTMTSEEGASVSMPVDARRSSSSSSGSATPSRDEHGLPTGATLREWRRAHPRATIADAVAAH